MAEITSLYLHGLGRTDLRRGEKFLLERRQRRHGIKFIPVDIDWCSEETMPELVGRVAGRADEILEGMNKNEMLLLEGTSAGGSLAFNVFGLLHRDPRVKAISHSGRLLAGDYRPGDWRSLAQCAHLGTERASQSFYDSLHYFEQFTLPSLAEQDMLRLYITLPLADEVVPVSTMSVEGIPTRRVFMAGHSLGIAAGLLCTPGVVNKTHAA